MISPCRLCACRAIFFVEMGISIREVAKLVLQDRVDRDVAQDGCEEVAAVEIF